MTGLAEGLELIWAFVLMLGVLITVHEFGHFIVAKWCGVKVLKFSVGVGPAIGFGRYRLRWVRGETEYVIAWLPLGGFVKMLGEDPDESAAGHSEEDWSRSLPAQPLWQKLAVVLAGPAMNLVLPVLVVVGFLWVGTEMPTSVVGSVDPGSPAAVAGIEPDDRIVSIDGTPTKWWSELASVVATGAGRTVSIEVERDGERLAKQIEIVSRDRIDGFRTQEERGWIGIQRTRQSPVLGVVSLTSPAAAAGLHSGDRVVRFGETAIEDWPDFTRAYERATADTVIRVARGPEDAPAEVELTVPALGSVARFGVIPAAVLIDAVAPGTPAAGAGLQAGDLIMAVDGEPVASFATFVETVLASGGRPLSVQYARGGETLVVRVAPELTIDDSRGMEEEVYRVGITAAPTVLPGDTALERYTDPRESFPRAVGRVASFTGFMVEAYGRLFSGEMSRKNLGGPIAIAKQSHQAFEAGWEQFLSLLIGISVNLAVLNMLPIPILDGGQALLYLIEGVKRGAVSVRTREIAQLTGLLMIVSLMGLAFWNDVTKYWASFVDWLVGLV